MDDVIRLVKAALAVQHVERLVWAEVLQILKDNLPADYPGDLHNVELPELVLFYITRMRELEAALAATQGV